jgi:hypothetical protein
MDTVLGMQGQAESACILQVNEDTQLQVLTQPEKQSMLMML